MSAQAGQDLLIKIDLDDAGSFQTLAGIRSSKISLNAQSIDTTHMGSNGHWRELLGGGGVKTAEINGSGVFVDADSDARARALFFEGEISDYQLVVPDFGVLEGKFQITNLEYRGSFDGEMLFEISLASASALNFTAENLGEEQLEA